MDNNMVKSEDLTSYITHVKTDNDIIIEKAIKILEQRLKIPENILISPSDTTNYLKLKLRELEYEIFACLMLDNRNRVIAFREMFRGTIGGASVYPREVVKQALSDNAAAVIFAHNHPSGVSEPSQSDIAITERLKKALALVDIRVLDHVIIGEQTLCFSERGLL